MRSVTTSSSRVAEAERRGDVEQSGFLRAAHARAEEAARELREIAGGLYPPALQQYGLAAALESLADTQPLALQTTLPAGRRYPARVEAAAYAVVAEATAQLPSLRVAVGESDGILELRLVGLAGRADHLARGPRRRRRRRRLGAGLGAEDHVRDRVRDYCLTATWANAVVPSLWSNAQCATCGPRMVTRLRASSGIHATIRLVSVSSSVA